TLTGPGGTGKTRLALELAARTASRFDGVHWLALAALRDPELLPAAIARELGDPDRHPAELIGGRRLLLALDNLEQLLPDAAGLAAALLAACPNLSVVATSRAPLRLQAERELPVPPLEESEAIALFGRRAEQHGFTFAAGDPAVAEIVRRVDCLPLAVELAAARLRLLSPAELLARLDRRLRVLTGGPRDAPARQQTLTATLDWSYDLLQPAEQQLFARLAVFAGGFTLEAAEVVCDADLDVLEGLLDASLLRRRDDPGELRYTMLAVVQEYAAGREEDEASALALRARHAEYYLAVAERAEPELLGASQIHALQHLEEESDNLRKALTYAGESGHGEFCLRLATALSRFWGIHGDLSEGRRWLTDALRFEEPLPARARALRAEALLAVQQGDFAHAKGALEQSAALHRQLDDGAGVASALNALGIVARHQADHAQARVFYEKSLELRRRLGDTWGVATTLGNLGTSAADEGDYATAAALLVESLTLKRKLGDVRGAAVALENLGKVALRQDDSARARSLLTESVAAYEQVGDKPGLANVLELLAQTELLDGDRARAATLALTALNLRVELNDKEGLATAFETLADVGLAQSDALAAGRLLGAAESLRAAIGAPLPEGDRVNYARIVSGIRSKLGERAFADSLDQGRARRSCRPSRSRRVTPAELCRSKTPSRASS
ncbi:MAG: tetratricopeptide repeat protein, partial [Gaiellaceae bacterium]